jgi:hypothetical protein
MLGRNMVSCMYCSFVIRLPTGAYLARMVSKIGDNMYTSCVVMLRRTQDKDSHPHKTTLLCSIT